MNLNDLKRRAKALEKSFAAHDNEIAATDGDLTEAQDARYDELFEEAASIKAELSALGFRVLFREAGGTAQRL